VVDVHSWLRQYPSFLYRGAQTDHTPGDPEEHRALRWYSPLSWVRAGLAARRADLVVLQWVTPVLAVPMLVVMWACRSVPTWVIVHNARPHERMPMQHLLARLVMGSADRLLAHSDEVAADIAGLAPASTVSVVPLPAILAGSVEHAPDPVPFRLLFAGFIRPYKGVDLLIEALARLDGDIVATIAGRPWDPDEETLRSMVTDNGLDERVVLELGYLEDARVAELVSSHHVVVAPYREASQSGWIPQAHAGRRPVVAAAVGGLTDQVRDGVDGILFTPESVEGLVDAVVECRRRYDELQRGTADSGSTWDDVAGALLEPERAGR
jgi:glycosyltransferase involved in cell wall biosynthesis